MSAELRAQVALACRVIALEGYVDLTLGHVSAREPGSRTIWIKRKGPALDEVGPDDVIALALDDADPLTSPDYHLETYIHTEVYRRRPDVSAVIHGHPLYATALGSTDGQLHILTHDAVLFVDGLGIFDEGPDLVTDAARAVRVAEALGHRRAALLRNHGIVIAAEDVRWAVLTALVLERAIRLQAIATDLGGLRPMSDVDAAGCRREIPRAFLDEYWDAWVGRAQSGRHAGEPLTMRIEPRINGAPTSLDVQPHDLLLDVLRERLGLTGAKRSCDVQVCGTCTVLVDGLPTSACTYLAVGRTLASDDDRGLRDTRSTTASRTFTRRGRQVASARPGWCSASMP
jgi:L-fuculose-phosphate aldolase